MRGLLCGSRKSRPQGLRGRVCYVNFALVLCLLQAPKGVLCGDSLCWDREWRLTCVNSEVRMNDGRILERHDWRAIEVEDMAWYNK